MKDIPPRSLTSWTQPARTTSLSMCSLSWEVRAVRLRWEMWLVGLLDRAGSAGTNIVLVLLGLLFLPIPNIETEGVPDNAPNSHGRARRRKW